MIYYGWPQLIEVLNQILMSNFFHSCNCNIVLPLTACLLFYLWEYKYTHFKKSFRPWETKAFLTRKTQHSEFVKMASASSFILFILQACACLFFYNIGAQANKTFSAIFSFGDSILDTGMNNNLLSGRCNYPPYGRDFPGKVATGRFCNGKNPTDLIGIIS